MKTLIAVGLAVGVLAMPQSIDNAIGNTSDILTVITGKPVSFVNSQFAVVTKRNILGQPSEAHNLFTGEPLR